MEKEITREIKEILSTIYGHRNVSVRAGRGTGTGHIDVRIKVADNTIETYQTTRDGAMEAIDRAGLGGRITVTIDNPPTE